MNRRPARDDSIERNCGRAMFRMMTQAESQYGKNPGRNYARYCRRARADDSQMHFPTFDEWKQAVDVYSEAD